MNDTKITIVTVCYNAVDTIEKTILSVINQTYKNIEYIIVDGASTDGTVDYIRKYENNITKWISEPDKGIYDAMNKGIMMATGLWINFMNAGDYFIDNNVISLFPYEEQYIAMYGNAYYITKNGIELRKGQRESVVYRDMPNTHQTFFVKTNVAKSLGFNTHYLYAADYNMIYRLYLQYGVKCLKYVDKDICYYDVRDGFSIKRPNEVFGETIRIRKCGIRKYYDLIKYYIKKHILRYQ